MTTEHQIESDTHSIVPVSIKSHLCSEAMHLKLDISKAAEQGLSTAIIKRREELWLANNREAIELRDRLFALLTTKQEEWMSRTRRIYKVQIL